MRVTLQIEEEYIDDLDVTEDEIQRIMEVQGIDRDAVLRCLRAAGTLADDSEFEEQVMATRKRAKAWSAPKW